MKVNKYKALQIILFVIYIIVYCSTFNNKENWIWTIILLINGLALVYFEYKRTMNYISPIMFWYVFWLLVIIIARLDLGVYLFNSVWQKELLILVIIATSTFFCFYWIGETLSSFKTYIKNNYEYDYEVIANITILFLLLACVAYVFNVLYTGVIPQISGNVDYYRRSFVITPFYSIVNCCRFVFCLIPIVIAKCKNEQKKTHIKILGVILCLFEFMTGWRTYVFQEMILFITSQLLFVKVSDKKERKKNNNRIKKYILIAMLFIGVVAVTRTGKKFTLSQAIEYIIQIVYLYIAPNFLNIQSAIQTITPKGYFLYSIEGIWGIFISSTSIEGYENIDQNIGGFNVSTYMLQPFADLGIAGVIIWTALISMFSGYVFYQAKQKVTVTNVFLLGMLNLTIFNMHNGFFLRSSSIIIWITIVVFIEYFTKRSKNCSEC